MEFYTGSSKTRSRFLDVKGRQVLTYGAPIYRFKQERDIRSVHFLKEEEIIHRTNDFMPAANRHYDFTMHQVRAIIQPMPEASAIDRPFLAKLVTKDTLDRTQYEKYDPLRGNSLISITVFDEPIYVFSASHSLSTVVFTFATKKECEINDYKVDARFDHIHIIDLFDLQYPIQQITVSPLSNRREGAIVGVRTTSTITIFRLDLTTFHNTMTVTKLHHFHLAEKTKTYPDIDYSMPCDLALSPFSIVQYLFITNNGFMALVDISRDELIFEGQDKMDDHLDYASRWRACSFTHIPSKYLICSPECIKEWTVTKSKIRSRLISVAENRIFCFTFQFPILCYSTVKEVRVFDIRNSNEPIIDWVHDMRDGPPTHAFIMSENTVENQWFIGVYSSISDRLSFIQLYYNSEMSTDLEKNVEVRDYFRLELSKNEFEPIYGIVETIHTVGLSTCLTPIAEKDGLFYSIYRLFENGEMRVQNIVLGRDSNNEDNKVEFKTKPGYILDDDRFEKLYLAVEMSKLPTNLDSAKEREIAHIKNRPFREYLEYISEFNEIAGPFSSSKKMNVAEELIAAKTPVTYHELFGKEGYYNLQLDDLLAHLEDIKEIERAEELPYIDPLIKGARTDNKSEFPEQSKNLKEAHEKEIKLSKIRLHVPSADEDTSSFQYLPKDIKYKSTMTTRILADDWSIDNTSSKNIKFTMTNEDKEIEREVFSLASNSRRRKSVSFALDSSIPSISFSPPSDERRVTHLLAGESASMFDEIDDSIPGVESTQDTFDHSQNLTPQVSSQVLPGRHGGRPEKKPSSKKKKKKQKTSGFK